MPTGVFLALSNPVSGEVENEFNDWYDNVHAKEVLGLDGVQSCRRFRLAPAQVIPGDDRSAHRYLALYEVDTDDWDALVAAFQNGFAEGRITVRPDLLELDPMVLTLAFEELDGSR